MGIPPLSATYGKWAQDPILTPKASAPTRFAAEGGYLQSIRPLVIYYVHCTG